MDDLNCKTVTDFSKEFYHDKQNKLAQNAVRGAGDLSTVLMDAYKARDYNEVFTNAIHVDVKATNQETSGRCWLFAILNVIRLNMIQNYKLDKEFELSQAYPFFWDQFEKSNYFLKKVIEFRNKPIDDQYNRILFSEPVSDGGQWNMVVNLVNKYGLVPKNDMDETFHTSNTDQMKRFLNNKLREYAVDIRKMPNSYFTGNKDILKKRLKEMMYSIFKIITIFMGTPPDKVDWSFYQNIPNIPNSKGNKRSRKTRRISRRSKYRRSKYRRSKSRRSKAKRSKKKRGIKKTKKLKGGKKEEDDKILVRRQVFPNNKTTATKDKTYAAIKNITPLEFYKNHINYNCDEKISLINFPHKSRPFYKVYKVEYANNMDNDNISTYINVPIDVMMKVASKSIKDGEALWFGSDVDKNVHHLNGIMDTESINYKETFDIDLEIEKGEALLTKAGEVNHAMVIKGFNCEKGKSINKWWVENSWGDENDNYGNYVMSTPWFKRHVYQIVIDKKYCDSKILDSLKSKPTLVKLWDPFGNLLIR